MSGTRYLGAYAFTVLAGYTQVGDAAGVDYDNVVSYGAGVNRRYTLTNIFAALQGQTSALPGGTDPLEFDMGFFRFITRDDVVVVHAFLGLSDGSPDDGVGVGLVRWFR